MQSEPPDDWRLAAQYFVFTFRPAETLDEVEARFRRQFATRAELAAHMLNLGSQLGAITHALKELGWDAVKVDLINEVVTMRDGRVIPFDDLAAEP